MADTPHDNSKIGRLAAEARGLVEDTREWVDAKLRLFELDIEEKIDRLASRFMVRLMVLFFSAMAAVFVGVAGALALGELWGSEPLGFLAASVLLLFIAGLIHAVRPRLVQGSMGVAERHAEAEKEKEKGKLPPQRQLPPHLPEGSGDGAGGSAARYSAEKAGTHD